ncbi:MAG: carbohydrate ABC transporter permease [Acidimicrobiales bacterium]
MSTRKSRRFFDAIVYTGPAFAVLAVFWIVPLVLVTGFSLFRWDYGTHPVFAGHHEYSTLLSSSLFWHSLVVTLVFAGGVVAVGSAISLFLAVLVRQLIRAAGLFRALFFLPYVTPIVATSAVWLWIYQPSVGLLDRILGIVGLPSHIAWVSYPNLALLSLVVYTIWYSFGFTTLLFLAGLTDIPAELLEAAALDGAGTWTRFRLVVWPLLLPTTTFVLVVNTINAFQSFTQIYALTQGGPVNGTTTLTYLIYELSFKYFHFGQASAAAVIFVLLIAALVTVELRVTRRSTYYQGVGST